MLIHPLTRLCLFLIKSEDVARLRGGKASGVHLQHGLTHSCICGLHAAVSSAIWQSGIIPRLEKGAGCSSGKGKGAIRIATSITILHCSVPQTKDYL